MFDNIFKIILDQCYTFLHDYKNAWYAYWMISTVFSHFFDLYKCIQIMTTQECPLSYIQRILAINTYYKLREKKKKIVGHQAISIISMYIIGTVIKQIYSLHPFNISLRPAIDLFSRHFWHRYKIFQGCFLISFFRWFSLHSVNVESFFFVFIPSWIEMKSKFRHQYLSLVDLKEMCRKNLIK